MPPTPPLSTPRSASALKKWFESPHQIKRPRRRILRGQFRCTAELHSYAVVFVGPVFFLRRCFEALCSHQFAERGYPARPLQRTVARCYRHLKGDDFSAFAVTPAGLEIQPPRTGIHSSAMTNGANSFPGRPTAHLEPNIQSLIFPLLFHRPDLFHNSRPCRYRANPVPKRDFRG
jgi:hypothetical protein